MFTALILGPVDAFRSAFATLLRRAANRAALDEMCGMDDDRLHDIGLTRAQLRRACATAMRDEPVRALNRGVAR